MVLSVGLNTLNGSSGFAIKGAGNIDNAGFSVSSVGDFNGDGKDDLVIGSPLADPNGVDSGQIDVVFGSSSL